MMKGFSCRSLTLLYKNRPPIETEAELHALECTYYSGNKDDERAKKDQNSTSLRNALKTVRQDTQADIVSDL